MFGGMRGRPEDAKEEVGMLRNHIQPIVNEVERGHVSDLFKERDGHIDSISVELIFRSVKTSHYMKQASNTSRFSLYDI